MRKRFLTTNSNSVTYPVLVIEVENIKCQRVLTEISKLEKGILYSSSGLIEKIKNKKPCRKECKGIECNNFSIITYINVNIIFLYVKQKFTVKFQIDC